MVEMYDVKVTLKIVMNEVCDMNVTVKTVIMNEVRNVKATIGYFQ